MHYNNLSEFKCDLLNIRDNRRVIRSKMKSLETLREDKLATINHGAIDYSREYVQSTPDPDKAIINIIAEIDQDIERLNRQINELKEENKPLEALIDSVGGVGGEILRLYYMEGLSMEDCAKQLNYSENNGWRLWRKTILSLYEEVNDD